MYCEYAGPEHFESSRMNFREEMISQYMYSLFFWSLTQVLVYSGFIDENKLIKTTTAAIIHWSSVKRWPMPPATKVINYSLNAKKGSPSGYCRVANKPIPALTMYKSNNELQSTDLKNSKFVRLQ